jgi:hypothetical protein
MGAEEKETKPDRVRGVERSLQVEVRGLGGFELRPTRVFVWGGDAREGNERVLSLDSAPRSLTIPRRPRERQAGVLELRTLGNPVMTVALASVHAARAARRRVTRTRPPGGSGSGRPGSA